MPKSYVSRYKELDLVDLDPMQTAVRDHIIKVCKDRCIGHGVSEVETPSLMPSSMKNMYPDEVIVRIKDDFLRCCLTVPLMALCARKNIKQGKFMQCGESYRVKNGKLQILLQLDFDILGDSSPMIQEAECVRLISEVSRILNLEQVWFRVNHRGLLMCILQVCGVLDEPTQRKVWKILAEHSHLEETDTSEVTRKLITAGIDRTSVAKLLKYLKLEGDLNFLDELEKDKYLLELPDAKEIIEQLRCFLTYCTNFRVPFKVSFDSRLVREFDYYTDLMLECICGDDGIPRVIACGGRYDRLACRVKEGFEVQCMGFTFCTEALRDLYMPLSVQESSSSNLGMMLCSPFLCYSFWYEDKTEMLCPPHGHLVWHGDTTEEVVLNGTEDEREPPSKDSTFAEESVMILCPDMEGAIKLVNICTQEQEIQEYMSPLQEKGPT